MRKHQWAYENFGWTDLTPENRKLLEQIELDFMPLRRNLQLLMEVELSNDQIDNLFKGAEQISRDKGLKTGFGKAVNLPKDALTKVNKLIGDFGEKLQNSNTIKGFDEKFTQIKANLRTKLESSDKGKATLAIIDRLGVAAKEHPVWQGAIIGLLTAATSLAIGPAAVPVVAFLLRGSAELIKGEKLSTALGKGIKTAAFGFLAGQVVGSIVNWASHIKVVGDLVGEGVKNVSFQGSQNLHGIASHFSLHNVVVTASDAARLNQLILDFGDPTHIGIAYNNLLDFAKNVTSPEYVAQIARNATKIAANQETQQAFFTSVQKMGSIIRAAAEGAATAAGDVKGKETTTESTRLSLPVMEGLWADLTLQFGAGKLMKAWKQAGRPTDSVDIAEMLAGMGMDDDDIRASMSKAGVSEEDIDATMKALASGEDDEELEIPFTSGIEVLDDEAKKILKTKGLDAFSEYWKEKLADLEKKAAEAAAPSPEPSASTDGDEGTVEDKIKTALANKKWTEVKKLIQAAKATMTNPEKFRIEKMLKTSEIDPRRKNEILKTIQESTIVGMDEFYKLSTLLKENQTTWKQLGYNTIIKEPRTESVILL